MKKIYYEGTNTTLLKLHPHMKSLNDLIQQGSGIADTELEKARGLTKPDHTAILTYSSVSQQKLYILHTGRELFCEIKYSPILKYAIFQNSYKLKTFMEIQYLLFGQFRFQIW